MSRSLEEIKEEIRQAIVADKDERWKMIEKYQDKHLKKKVRKSKVTSFRGLFPEGTTLATADQGLVNKLMQM